MVLPRREGSDVEVKEEASMKRYIRYLKKTKLQIYPQYTYLDTRSITNSHSLSPS